MPKRQSVIRFFSEEVQGEKSWVLIALPTVEEIRKIRKIYKEAAAEKKDTFDIGIELLKTHVKKWNWVWQDGSDMPQPTEDPTVIEKLTDPETAYLSACITGSEKDAKN